MIGGTYNFSYAYKRLLGLCQRTARKLLGRKLHIELKSLDILAVRFPEDLMIMLDLLREFKHTDGDKYAHLISIEIVQVDERIPPE